MDRIFPARLRRASGRPKKGQPGRSQQSKRRIPLIKWSVFIMVSAVCGLIIACMPLLLSRSDISDTATRVQNHASAVKSNAPLQNNPLFASAPSWIQDFTGQTSGLPDPLSWNVLVGPAENSNKEQQYYTDSYSNVRVENGALRLIATNTLQPGGYKYSSARLETEGKKSFLYGRIDITAKLPRGVGTWPAVWLLPATDTYAKKSADSDIMRYRNGGEIDIIEAVGFEPGVVYGVAHTVSDLTNRSDGTGSFKSVSVPTASTDFNTYSLFWTPTSLTYAVNGKEYFTYSRKSGADYKTWPFDQPFYLIVNLAMGGTWGGMDTAHFPGDGIDNAALPSSLDIRSIYYYPYIGSMNVQ